MMGARSLATLKDATRFYRSHQASWQRQRQLSVVGWQLSAAEDRSTAIFHGRRTRRLVPDLADEIEDEDELEYDYETGKPASFAKVFMSHPKKPPAF
jgi:hypothetical protein